MVLATVASLCLSVHLIPEGLEQRHSPCPAGSASQFGNTLTSSQPQSLIHTVTPAQSPTLGQPVEPCNWTSVTWAIKENCGRAAGCQGASHPPHKKGVPEESLAGSGHTLLNTSHSTEGKGSILSLWQLGVWKLFSAAWPPQAKMPEQSRPFWCSSSTESGQLSTATSVPHPSPLGRYTPLLLKAPANKLEPAFSVVGLCCLALASVAGPLCFLD